MDDSDVWVKTECGIFLVKKEDLNMDEYENVQRELDVLLHQVLYGLGPFDNDYVVHAENVIEAGKRHARRCLELLNIPVRPIEKVYGDSVE